MNGDILLQELQRVKLLSEVAVTKIKRDVILTGRSPEELIYKDKVVDDRKVAEAKSAFLKVPLQKVDDATYDASFLELIPEETARTYQSIALGKKDNLLIVGMVNPDDIKSQEALKFVARKNHLNLGVYLISYGDWQDILRKYSPYKSEVEHAVESLNLKPGEGNTLRKISLEESAGEAGPIIKIVSDTFREALESRASDIHIEPEETYLRIRFRVDGELKEAASLPAELAQPIISRIKIISSLKIDENRIPQDGRFRTKILDREIDFRVSTFPTPLGEKVAIRVLDSATGIKSFDALGLTGKNFEVMKEALAKPYGLILVTGPTGSGKTTTLYAILQELNKEGVNIVSLEDPVEYFVSGVNQSQVRPEIGYDFASGLRQILRQDPDIIMVGEIRDDETASLAVQSALTGHIVISTLHTNNSAGVIPRLIDMKVPPFLLPVSLNLMVAQRLVGILCDACRAPEIAPPSIQKIIKKALTELPSDVPAPYEEPYKTYHAPGCPKCKGRGVLGRIAIFEMLKMTPALAEIVNTEPSLQKIFKEAREQGMLTLRQDGILKALQGSVSVEEVIRETEEQ